MPDEINRESRIEELEAALASSESWLVKRFNEIKEQDEELELRQTQLAACTRAMREVANDLLESAAYSTTITALAQKLMMVRYSGGAVDVATRSKTEETYDLADQKFTDVEQMHKCVEECAELSVALMHYLKPVPKSDALARVVEELADVSIMVDQLARRFGRKEFENWRERKLDRLRDRLMQAF